MGTHVAWMQPSDFATVMEVAGRLGIGADESAVDEYLSDARSHLLIGFVSTEPAGFARAAELLRLDGRARQMLLYEIETRPSYRRRGVATAIIGELWSHCVANGFRNMFVVADKSNQAAMGLYPATGALPHSPTGDDFVWSWDLTVATE